jgi:hypothetical protein
MLFLWNLIFFLVMNFLLSSFPISKRHCVCHPIDQLSIQRNHIYEKK